MARTISYLRYAKQVLFNRRNDGAAAFYELVGEDHALFGHRSFLNVGYWEETCDDIGTASRALCDLVAQCGQFGLQERILDVGCGFGAAALYWQKSGVAASITGVNISPLQVAAATELARDEQVQDQVRFVLGNACELPFPDGVFSRVVALESSLHFPSRTAFIGEAYRVLEPGGILVSVDPLPRPGPYSRGGVFFLWLARRVYQMPAANQHDAPTMATMLSERGFVEIDVKSIYEQTVQGLYRHMRGKVRNSRQWRFVRRTQERVLNWSARVSPFDYVLSVARKPL